ncbi:PIG-L deacetylase family protein [Kribbella sp. ALI-6-A]|uniref:PIG-L deacetylase family protein n=1 Tax=Kribbella sp. ALI-6-A TaxID=1933817 RepID=UPI00143DB952|nr:PIG-L deacetylase family protein [Kribbella sp. ALI-6-A]
MIERTALVVHAHPDDEVFATGAATIALSDAGWQVVLRVASGGEAGEDPELGEADARRVRTGKLARSCELLGISEWGWLGEPGQWIDRGGDGGPGTVADAESAILVDAVRRALVDVRPDVVLTVGGDGLTGHPDHVAMGAAVREAARAGQVEVLGARLRAADVAAGRAELGRLIAQGGTPGRQKPRIGSGRVVGAGNEIALVEVSGSGLSSKSGRGERDPGRPIAEDGSRSSTAETEQRRRAALDVYRDGLGSLPLREVVSGQGRLGDSVLLRAVLDVRGWDRDLFERG